MENLARYYSCTCCANAYLASPSSLDPGCDLCGSSIVCTEVTDFKIFEILKSNLKRMSVIERILEECQVYGQD